MAGLGSVGIFVALGHVLLGLPVFSALVFARAVWTGLEQNVVMLVDDVGGVVFDCLQRKLGPPSENERASGTDPRIQETEVSKMPQNQCV
jgi:hypothetical protein